jgi:hypothetical protein
MRLIWNFLTVGEFAHAANSETYELSVGSRMRSTREARPAGESAYAKDLICGSKSVEH